MLQAQYIRLDAGNTSPTSNQIKLSATAQMILFEEYIHHVNSYAASLDRGQTIKKQDFVQEQSGSTDSL